MPASIPTSIPRNALVTGAAKRLGRSIALELARQGFDIAIHCGHSLHEAEETRGEILALGRRAVVLPADLTDEAQVTTLLPSATEQLGPIGVLINGMT
jgi:NAD(P)-dependent dehydrogenase (short-subunit alcohol dehydrogenase family)